MWLITIIIIIILIICIRVLIDDITNRDLADGCIGAENNLPTRGHMNNNTIMLDVSGTLEQYGNQSLVGAVNYNYGYSGYRNGHIGSYNDEDNDGGDDYGNFTNRPRPDPFYLEDIGESWAENCMHSACSGKLIGRTCDVNSPNPKKEYQRSYGGSMLVYNDDMADPSFKHTYLKNSAIHVPWSDTYNNIMPANPSIR